jgi:hypothetical protein
MSSNSLSGIIGIVGKEEDMDVQAIQRLTTKNERQSLFRELQQYRLSPIEASAVCDRV